MDHGEDWGALLRFAVGAGATVLAGFLFFRLDAFHPSGPWFHCVTTGALTAGILALVRTARPGQAAALAVAFALVHIGYSWTQGWRRAAAESGWAIVVGGGVLLAALIFDRLGEQRRYRFGKFALLGPLLAGVFVAAWVVRMLAPGWGDDAVGSLVRQAVVGLIVGDAAGLGVELVELLPALAPTKPRAQGG